VKFGKSEGGAIWLDSKKTSPYKFYQFWLNVDDETAEDLIKIYTLLPKDVVDRLIGRHRENPSERELQKTLAHEVTTLIHGSERCGSVKKVTEVLFGSKQLNELDEKDIDELANEIPTVSPAGIQQVLLEAGLASSGGEARRFVEAGAVKVNGMKVDSLHNVDAPSLVKRGKNGFALVR